GLEVDRDVAGAAALAPRCAVEVLVTRVDQLVVRARGVIDLGAAVVEHEVPLADDAAVGVTGLHLDLEIDHLAVGIITGHVVLAGVVAHRGDDGDHVAGLLVGELGADLDDGALIGRGVTVLVLRPVFLVGGVLVVLRTVFAARRLVRGVVVGAVLGARVGTVLVGARVLLVGVGVLVGRSVLRCVVGGLRGTCLTFLGRSVVGAATGGQGQHGRGGQGGPASDDRSGHQVLLVCR